MSRHPDRLTVVTTPKVTSPDESWWTKYADPGSAWAAFSEAAKQRDLEAGWTKHGDRTRPSAMEERL